MNSFGYRPEIDGLRAVAVYLVVAYHSGVSLFGNGYLGVDVFFVLSGFLVTNVLLNELDDRGDLRFRRFFARRIRRLLPAASVTILVTLTAWRFVAEEGQRVAIRPDARSAALWFANLNAVAQIRSGIDDPRPLFHFWSLSIEEQYYVLFPVLVFGLWLWQRRLSDVMWIVLVVGAVAGAGLQTATNRLDPTAAYYYTHLRIYQMLFGAALAAVLRRRPNLLPQLPPETSVVALLGTVLLSLDVAPSVGPSARGVLTSLLVVVVLLGLMRNESWGRKVLSAGPMVYLGSLSYAVYLFHVPLGVITDAAVGRLDPWVKLVYTAIVATALAALSGRMLERPIRVNAFLDRIPGRVIAVGLASSALVGFILTPALA